MKNILRFLPIVIALFAFTSCDRDYACICTAVAAQNPNAGNNVPQDYTYTVNAQSGADADEKCNTYETTLPDYYQCDIK